MQGVGAGDYYDVGVVFSAGEHSGFDAGEKGSAVDYFFAAEVTAAFDLDLIFDVEACNAGTDVLADGVSYVKRT